MSRAPLGNSDLLIGQPIKWDAFDFQGVICVPIANTEEHRIGECYVLQQLVENKAIQ